MRLFSVWCSDYNVSTFVLLLLFRYSVSLIIRFLHFHENPDHGETAVRAGPAVRFGSAAGTFHDIFLPKM